MWRWSSVSWCNRCDEEKHRVNALGGAVLDVPAERVERLPAVAAGDSPTAWHSRR
jgi:hypothetical protein